VGTTRLIDNIPVDVGPGGGALEVFSEDAGRHHDLTSPTS
jgi:pantoate--beta-alanine ligase